MPLYTKNMFFYASFLNLITKSNLYNSLGFYFKQEYSAMFTFISKLGCFNLSILDKNGTKCGI